MAKKFIAVQYDPESFDWNAFYDEACAESDLLFVYHGDFEFNNALKKDLTTMISDLAYDDETISNDDSYDSEEDRKSERLDLAKQYVSNFMSGWKDDFTKSEISQISEDDLWKILKLVSDYQNGGTLEETTAMLSILETIFKEEFDIHTLRGYSQSDWCEVVCPKHVENRLDFIEAVFFGTGTEYMICETPIETTKEDGSEKTVDELIEEAQSLDCISDYTAEYSRENIKKWILDNYANYGENKNYTIDDIRLINITGTYTKTFNTYEIQ